MMPLKRHLSYKPLDLAYTGSQKGAELISLALFDSAHLLIDITMNDTA